MTGGVEGAECERLFLIIALINRWVIMLYNYPPLRYSPEYPTITICLLQPSSFAAFSLFTTKPMTTAPIEEAPMNEFYTRTFGADCNVSLSVLGPLRTSKKPSWAVHLKS